jgi:hypothetical protein
MSDRGDGDAKGSRDEPKARTVGCKALKRSSSSALPSLTTAAVLGVMPF